MKELVIHKVAFTEESIFDYEHCLVERNYPRYRANATAEDWEAWEKYEQPTLIMPKSGMKTELEEYLGWSNRTHRNYLRVRWVDEHLDIELMLFMKKSVKISIMQNWTVVGICPAEAWNEELEDDGVVRAWYNTATEDLPNEEDWVEVQRNREAMHEADRIKDEKERERHARLFA